MKPGELLRVRVAFGALGAVPVFLAGWFASLQVAQAGALESQGREPLPLNAQVAERYIARSEKMPAPRGVAECKDQVLREAVERCVLVFNRAMVL